MVQLIKTQLGSNPKVIYIAAAVTIFKIGLIFLDLYHSTDFEVHRNWLAITYSLPISQWYLEATSIWTLDYPPLFGWFSRALSYPASYVDPHMLNVTSLNYAAPAAVYYLRASVILTDALLIFATKQCCDALTAKCNLRYKRLSRENPTFSAGALQYLLLCNVGLLIVDHIHFQYNGVLFGLFLLSIVAMIKNKFFLSAFYFAVLLNAKHIFLYIAPVYFVYLLRSVCLPPYSDGRFQFRPLFKLAAIVAAVFSTSLLPFILTGQSAAMLERLFPFKRGLFHSYWAGNVWALYCFADKVGELVLRLVGVAVPHSNITSGLTWDVRFSLLPAVHPPVTFLLTVLAMLPCLFKLWRSPMNSSVFVKSLVICALTSFMFGWHVHEKAILMSIIPLTVLAVQQAFHARIFFILSTTGYLSLLPLIPLGLETVITFTLFLGHIYFMCRWLPAHFKLQSQSLLPSLTQLECVYVCGMTAVLAALVALPLVAPRMEFLPLLIVSVYSSIGFIYTYIVYYVDMFSSPSDKLHFQ